jgi:PAS domain S-box-containing protein
MPAPVPENEEERLRALNACRILDTPPEPEFDDVTLLAAQICGVPLAAVSLIDRDRQWFKSILGLDATETPRDVAFCAHTILQPELMVVPDAQSDPRFADNPLVTGELGIRFYAGMPLLLSDGLALGSLCVIDKKPRQLSADQQTALRALGNQVASQIELKRYIAAQEQLMQERLEVEQQLQAEITERRRTEAELERAMMQNAQVLASISSILIGVDENGLISTWNGAASRAFGLRTPEMLGRVFLSCGIPWNWDTLLAGIKQCEDERKPILLEDVPCRTPDGAECFLGVTLNPISHYSDEPQGFLLLAADITQRRVMEGQLATAQKLESIGQLAAGIAHEINTPVQYVGDNLRFLQESMNDLRPLLDLCRTCALPEISDAVQEADLDYLQAEMPNAAAQAQEGISRVAHIVRAMKEFSHPGTTQKTATDLNRALDSTLTVAHNEWKYVADLVTDFDPSLPLIPCLAAEMNQVFLNMIVNAAHAISDVVGDGSLGKGTITVRTRLVAGCAEISFADTGCGMTDEVKARIFDPFFTTKPVGRGTGQGLAISHAVVVEKHRGRIAVETAPGRGTCFVICLPIVETGE